MCPLKHATYTILSLAYTSCSYRGWFTEKSLLDCENGSNISVIITTKTSLEDTTTIPERAFLDHFTHTKKTSRIRATLAVSQTLAFYTALDVTLQPASTCPSFRLQTPECNTRHSITQRGTALSFANHVQTL